MAVLIAILVTIVALLFYSLLVTLCVIFFYEIIDAIIEAIDNYKRNLTNMN